MTIPQLIAWCADASDAAPDDALDVFLKGSDADAACAEPRDGTPRKSGVRPARVAPAIAVAEERALAERIAQGDEVAFQTTYRALYSPLREFAFALTRDDGAAHDIVQDVLFAFWNDRARVQLRDRFVPYLYKAVRNQTAKYRRHERVVRRSVMASIPDLSTVGMAAPPPASDVAIEDAELHAALLAAVETLPDAQRAAVTLHLTDTLTAAEIGDVLGTTSAAVLMSLSRARTTLRAVLAKFGR